MASRSFSLFLALRYLKPKRTFLSIITLISILGVTLGVMVLILVISVMTGFERELTRKVVGFDAHLMVSNSGVMDDWPDVMKQVSAAKNVTAVAPFVQGPVLVEFQNRRMAPKIRGIDPELEGKVVSIRDFIIAGAFDLDGDKTVLGSELARTLGAGVGDKVNIFSPGNLNQILEELDRVEKEGDKTSASALKQMILPTELEVTGIFESGRYLYDSEFLLVPLHIGQEIYNLGGGAHGLAVKITDPFLADQVKHELNETLTPPNMALTWIDLNRQLFDAIRMERNVMFFLLLFIILVAAFGIMNTLITVTVQKTREIGIMKALGARTMQIIGVFLAQGIVVGVFGYSDRLADWHHACPVSQSGERLAGLDAGHRGFPPLDLSVQRDSRGGNTQGCGDHLHQRVHHLLAGSANPCLVCCPSRSRQGSALRIAATSMDPEGC